LYRDRPVWLKISIIFTLFRFYKLYSLSSLQIDCLFNFSTIAFFSPSPPHLICRPEGHLNVKIKIYIMAKYFRNRSMKIDGNLDANYSIVAISFSAEDMVQRRPYIHPNAF